MSTDGFRSEELLPSVILVKSTCTMLIFFQANKFALTVFECPVNRRENGCTSCCPGPPLGFCFCFPEGKIINCLAPLFQKPGEVMPCHGASQCSK